jgi:hypothetical protein
MTLEPKPERAALLKLISEAGEGLFGKWWPLVKVLIIVASSAGGTIVCGHCFGGCSGPVPRIRLEVGDKTKSAPPTEAPTGPAEATVTEPK